MRNLLPICAGLLVVSGIVSITLWRELRTERQARAELQVPPAQPKSQEPTPAAPVQTVSEAQPKSEPPATISPQMAPAAKAVVSSGLLSTDAATVSST